MKLMDLLQGVKGSTEKDSSNASTNIFHFGDNISDEQFNSYIMNMKFSSLENILEEKKYYIELYLEMLPFYYGIYKNSCQGSKYKLYLSNEERVILNFSKKYSMHLIGLDYCKIKNFLIKYAYYFNLDKDEIEKMSSDKIMDIICDCNFRRLVIDGCELGDKGFIEEFFKCISDYGFKKLCVMKYLSEKSLSDFSNCFIVKNPNDCVNSSYAVIYGYEESDKVVINGVRRSRISCMAFCVGTGVNKYGKQEMYLSSSRYFDYKDELEAFIKGCEICYVNKCKKVVGEDEVKIPVDRKLSVSNILNAFPMAQISYGDSLIVSKQFLHENASRNALSRESLRTLLTAADMEADALFSENGYLRDQIAELYDAYRTLQHKLEAGANCNSSSKFNFIYNALNLSLREKYGVSVTFDELKKLAFRSPYYTEICNYIQEGMIEYKQFFDEFLEEVVKIVNLKSRALTYDKRKCRNLKINSNACYKLLLPCVIKQVSNNRIQKSSILDFSEDAIRSGLIHIGNRKTGTLYKYFVNNENQNKLNINDAYGNLLTYLNQTYDVVLKNWDEGKILSVINDITDDRARLIMKMNWSSKKYSLREINDVLIRGGYNTVSVIELSRIFNGVLVECKRRIVGERKEGKERRLRKTIEG